MRLLLARHGQSVWNQSRKFQGAHDVGLSDLGRTQAEALGRAVQSGYRARVAYASPMRRALETAEIALAGTGIPLVPIPELRELSLGEWEGCTVDEIRAREGNPYLAWVRSPLDCPPPGGEPLPDVCARVLRAIARIGADHRNGDDVLVVAHGGVISVYLCHLLGVSFNSLWRMRIDNCSLTIARPPRLVSINDTTHLPPTTRTAWFDVSGAGGSAVTVLIALFGGMALLLYGIRLSGEAFQRALGSRLRNLLTGLSRRRLMAVLSGAAITALIQSSAATTLMLIGFVSAGLMTFRQTLGLILGADIGTTFTVQLIAFRVTDYSPLLVGLGFTTMFVARRRVPKDLGQALLGLGLMFLGLKLILDNVEPIRSTPLAVDLLNAVGQNPALGVLAGAVVSALVTSSAATLGLALAFAHQGLLSLDGAVAIVLGANIGTCATALTASVGATAEAKRVAVAHIAFKVLGAALVFPFIGPFTAVVASTAADPARQIANAHTLFNFGISFVFLPFTRLAARAIETLVPDDQQGDSPFRTRYVDERSLDQPSLALGQATREALRMADVVQGMLRDVPVVFASSHYELLEDVERRDDQVDFLEREIKLFLARLGRDAMGPDLSRKEIGLISVIGNLENIGDIIDKNLMELGRKKLYQARRFSDAGWAEIQDFHGMVSKNLERAIAAFAANDRALAQEVLDQRTLMRQRERDLRESHLGRLRAGLAESIETSEIHLDVLTNLKRISSHVSALAISILEEV